MRNLWRVTGLIGCVSSLAITVAVASAVAGPPGYFRLAAITFGVLSAAPALLCLAGFLFPRESRIGRDITYIGIALLLFSPMLLLVSIAGSVFHLPSMVILAAGCVLRVRKEPVSKTQGVLLVLVMAALLAVAVILLNGLLLEKGNSNGQTSGKGSTILNVLLLPSKSKGRRD